MTIFSLSHNCIWLSTWLCVLILVAENSFSIASDHVWNLGTSPLDSGQEIADSVLLRNGDGLFKDSSLRDVEHLEHSSLWGHKYMGGGAGEGRQFLSPTGIFPNKQEIKTDAILPAYCDPPNPCPIGATADDGCLEEFENTAEFSRLYQQKQDCLCDEDHMFTCSINHRKSVDDANEIEFQEFLDSMLNKAALKDRHKGLVAKKFHEKKRQVKRFGELRNNNVKKSNPYLMMMTKI